MTQMKISSLEKDPVKELSVPTVTSVPSLCHNPSFNEQFLKDKRKSNFCDLGSPVV